MKLFLVLVAASLVGCGIKHLIVTTWRSAKEKKERERNVLRIDVERRRKEAGLEYNSKLIG